MPWRIFLKTKKNKNGIYTKSFLLINEKNIVLQRQKTKKTMAEEREIKIFTGTATRYLTEKIVKHYGVEIGMSAVTRFSDGEFEPRFDEPVRGKEVYIVQ